MGGCRCSYKTCKARTDGQTHMFHFPVFDKIRCHQWITNAMKPNFLNLMLSQLKNRVVCQYHFREDCFMNYKREKLKNTAVPTEDGPYCTSTEVNIEPAEDSKPVMPINADDIENEILNHIEKRANTSVKYGDFLISDTTELFNTTLKTTGARKEEHSDGNTPKKLGVGNKDNYTLFFSNEPTAHSSPNSVLNCNVNTPNLRKRIQNNPEIDVPEIFGPSLYSQTTTTTEGNTPHEDIPIQTNPLYSNSMPSLSIVSIEYDDQAAKQPRKAQTLRPKSTTRVFNPDKVVKILSEKTISEPLKLKGRLEPVSPSIIVKAPARRSQRVNNWHKPEPNNDDRIKTEVQISNTVENVQAPFEHILPVEYVPDPKEYTDPNVNPVVENNNLNEVTLNIEAHTEISHQNNNKQSATQIVLNDFMNQNENQTPTLKGIESESEPVKVTNQENSPRKPKKAPKSRFIGKNMLPPEKLAAIEEKRKYNMKLRDVINSCIGDSLAGSEAFDKALFEEIQQNLGTLHTKNPRRNESTNQDSTIAYLETRLQHMEETLSKKIDHNTYKINDLKRAIKPKFGVKVTSTQTHSTEKEHKHYLYKEISKYLSSNANSTIYGELFLNTQSAKEAPPSSPRKRLKR